MTTSRATQPAQTADSAQLRKVTLAGSLGIFVEFYDYGAYGFLAATIAAVFFPGQGTTAALLMTYGIFAITFFFRPLGGLVLGYLADRAGRRTALVLALTLMTGATTVIGLLPGYATIGIAAPILLLITRIIQGFSAGGEVASAMSFVGEHAPTRRRGYLMSWMQVGSFVALLTGTLLGVLLTDALDTAAMHDWGWRIPFLLAAPLGVVGYFIRSKLHDTPVFERLRKSGDIASNPLKDTFTSKENRRNLLLAIGVPLLNSSGYYILFTYMPTYLSHELKFTQAQGLIVTALALLVIVASIPLAARFSDRAGRRPVLLGSAISLAVLTYPCFWLLSRGNVGLAVVGAAVLSLLFAGHAGIIHAVLVEMFPSRVRNTAYSLGYNISTAVFGGAAAGHHRAHLPNPRPRHARLLRHHHRHWYGHRRPLLPRNRPRRAA
jgi:MFS transporter, MHS family, proline/betaine transporter